MRNKLITILMFLPRKLRSELRVAAIVPATSGEGIVASFEFSSHLLVGGPTSGHQNHVETRETEYWDR